MRSLQTSLAPGETPGMTLGMAYQVLVGPDGRSRRFIYVSENCADMNGVAPHEVMGDPEALYGLIEPEDRVRMAQVEARAMAERRSFDIEVAMRRRDGTLRWRRIAATPRAVAWPDGSTLWDGIQLDITDQRATALKLQEQQRRLDLAVEATGLGFWEWDLTDNSLTWSERNRELFGLRPDAPLTIAAFMEAVHPEDRDLIRKAYADGREAGEEADFSMEYRVVTPQGGLRWLLVHGRVTHRENRPDLVVGTSLDITERKLAEERRTLLVRELAHRAKNGLAVIMAVVAQTARGATSVQAYQQALTARLTAMALSQDLITESDGASVSLLDLATKVLEPFDVSRFTLDAGLAEAPVSGDIAIGAALLLHELATNAVKYGALSSAEGVVAVDRLEDIEGRAVVVWRERGGPPVGPPRAPGFGTRLLQAALRSRGGQVEPSFEPEGFSARMELPVAR